MRKAIFAIAAVFTLGATPALANPDEATFNWLKLASSPDAGRNLYMEPDAVDSSEIPGARLIVLMQTRAGPATAIGYFAVHMAYYVQCADNTMAISNRYYYDRAGEGFGGEDVENDDLDFQPADLGNQYGLALQVACGAYDKTTLPQTGFVTAHQLIEADIAAYDAQNGGTYAY